MGWLLNTLAKAILRALCSLFSLLAEDFITIFGINIGADFPTLDGANKSLVSVLSSYGKDSGLTSVFDAMFPMTAFKKIIVSMAVVIATGLLVVELMKAMAAPMTRGRKQHPATSVLKYAVAIPGVFLSYRIFICMEYIGNEFYRSFGKAALNLQKNNTVSSGKLVDLFSTENGGGGLMTALNIADPVGNTGAFAFVTGASAAGIALTFLNLMIVWLLFVNFLRLIIEVMERYMVLGILFYTAPLPFATLASSETSNIFSSWMKMTLSQMLLIITNGMFISVFLSGLIKITTKGNGVIGFLESAGEGIKFSGRLSWTIWALLLVAWLLLAQRFDSYLNSLGLSTAQTGGGLASAVRSGAMAVGGVTAAMGRGYAKSDLRKNVKERTPGPARMEEAGNSLVNGFKKAVGRVTGDSKMWNEGNRAQANANARTKLSQDLRGQGFGTEGRALADGTTLRGDKAKAVGMAAMRNNPNAQRLIGNANNVQFGKDQDGALSITGNEAKTGNPFSITLGASSKGGSSLGFTPSGVEASMQGSASTVDKVLSTGGQSVTAQNASRFAAQSGANYSAVQSKDGTQYGIRNNTTGQVAGFAPEGALGLTDTQMATSGFVTHAVSAGTEWQTIGASQQIDHNQHVFADFAGQKGFSNVVNALQNTSPLSNDTLQDLTIATQMSAPAATLLEGIGTWTPDGQGGLIGRTINGDAAYISMYNPDSTGLKIDNGLGLPMYLNVTEVGSGNILQSVLAASPNTYKEAENIGSFLSKASNLDVSVGDATDGYYPVTNSEGDVVAHVTSAANIDALGGQWHLHNGHAFCMTEAGRSWCNENIVGWDENFIDNMIANEMRE